MFGTMFDTSTSYYRRLSMKPTKQEDLRHIQACLRNYLKDHMCTKEDKQLVQNIMSKVQNLQSKQ